MEPAAILAKPSTRLLLCSKRRGFYYTLRWKVLSPGGTCHTTRSIHQLYYSPGKPLLTISPTIRWLEIFWWPLPSVAFSSTPSLQSVTVPVQSYCFLRTLWYSTYLA